MSHRQNTRTATVKTVVKRYYEEITPQIEQAKRIITMIEANLWGVERNNECEQVRASLFFIHRQNKELKEPLKAINAICNRYGGKIANLCKEKTACNLAKAKDNTE
ncbi:hypothetical protein ACN9OL_10350 [Glaesserella parasuis]|uniref:hypothetical protein n=1 Tax=Glaesserella parasuis TaxID=738 RepID=UPI002719A607|nr:hypothetical protein [Glaesserella parasuis]